MATNSPHSVQEQASPFDLVRRTNEETVKIMAEDAVWSQYLNATEIGTTIKDILSEAQAGRVLYFGDPDAGAIYQTAHANSVSEIFVIDRYRSRLQKQLNVLSHLPPINRSTPPKINFAVGNADWKDSRFVGFDAVVLPIGLSGFNDDAQDRLFLHMFGDLKPACVVIGSPSPSVWKAIPQDQRSQLRNRATMDPDAFQKRFRKVAHKYGYLLDLQTTPSRQHIIASFQPAPNI